RAARRAAYQLREPVEAEHRIGRESGALRRFSKARTLADPEPLVIGGWLVEENRVPVLADRLGGEKERAAIVRQRGEIVERVLGTVEIVDVAREAVRRRGAEDEESEALAGALPHRREHLRSAFGDLARFERGWRGAERGRQDEEREARG